VLGLRRRCAQLRQLWARERSPHHQRAPTSPHAYAVLAIALVKGECCKRPTRVLQVTKASAAGGQRGVERPSRRGRHMPWRWWWRRGRQRGLRQRSRWWRALCGALDGGTRYRLTSVAGVRGKAQDVCSARSLRRALPASRETRGWGHVHVTRVL
jgi:hypothetical protein